MAGADFVVGLEVQPRGAGLQKVARETRVLTDATRESGQEQRRARTATTDLEQAERRRRASLDQLSQAVRANNLALAQAKSDIAQYHQRVEAAAEAKRRATGVVNSFRAAIVALQIAVAALGLGALVRDSVNVALAFDRANKSLVAATGSQQLAGREMAFVSAEADRLGLVLTSTAQTYTGLANAARGTVLQGQAARDIFSAVSEASTVLGLSADQAQGALLGVQQTISKGKVTSEELVQQISERLPGAYQAMADSLGLSTAELAKRLEQGKVGLKDLIGWAEELRKRFAAGLTTAVNSYQANINRLTNLTQQLKREVGEGFLSGFLTGFADLKEALSAAELKAAARDLGESIGSALRTAADAAAFLAKHLEAVKALLLVLLSLKVASWFVSLAGAIATATGATMTFKSALSSLAIAGPLAAIGVALLAVIVIMQKYIMTTRLAMEAEMAKVARSQELFGYYQTLKANKVGLTEAEALYAVEVRKTMEAERAALVVSLQRAKADAVRFQFAPAAGFAPSDAGRAERVKDLEREVQTIDNMLNGLQTEWDRLGKLPTIKLPVDPGDVDEAAKKVTDLLSGFQRTAEQAERIRAAQERGGASEAGRVTAEIERQNAAYQALHAIEGLSAASKARLTAVIEGLVGRTQDASRATAESAAKTARSLTFTQAALDAEARLADAKSQTTVASRQAAIQAEAEGIARENLREGDAEYVAGLLQVIRVRHDYLDSVALEIAAIVRQIAHVAAVRQKHAELADAVEQGTSATRRLAVEIEAETEARARGVQVGSVWHQLLLAIAATRAQEIEALEHQTAAQLRLNEAESRRAQARAEFTDWTRQRDAAKAYGSEIAGIISQYGLLSEATRDLAIHEQALAQFREAGNTRTLEQIEAELQGYAAIEVSLARVAAATELQAHIVAPVREAWAQVGQMLQEAVIDQLIEGKVNVEDLAKTILRTMLSALAEMLKRWILTHRMMQAEAMKTAAVNAAAAQAGGGGGGGGAGMGGMGTSATGMAFNMGRQAMTSSATGAAGSGMSAMMGVAWVAAIFAVVYFGVSQWIKTNKEHIAQATFRLEEEGRASVHDIHGNRDRMKQVIGVVEGAGKMVIDWLASIGGAIEQASNSVTVGRTGQGSGTKWFVKDFATGAKEWFKTQEEAFGRAMILALQSAHIKGLDPIVLAAIKNSTAQTWEDFQAGMADAVKVAGFGKAGAGLELRAAAAEFDRLRESMRKLLPAGEALSDALARINEQEILVLQSQRDAITGKQRTAAEEHQMRLLEMRAWNAELAMRKANVDWMIIETKAKIANYRGTAILIGGNGGGGGGREGGLLGLGTVLYMTAGVVAAATTTIAEGADAGLKALEDYLKGLEDLKAAYGGMKPIDEGELIPRTGGKGGGGGRDLKGERDDLLDEMARWKLTDVGNALRDTTRWFSDFRDRIKDLGFSAAKQAELLAAAGEELRRQQAAIKKAQLEASADFINAGTARGGPLLQGLTDNTRTQAALIQANRDLWREGQLTKREMRALNAAIREAGERQRQQMVQGAADSLLMDLYQLLGDEEAAAQLRYDMTLAELDIRRAELAIAMETLGWEKERRDVILGTVDSLITKVREIGPAIFSGSGGADGGGVTRNRVNGYRDANGVFHWTDLEQAANDNAAQAAEEARRLQQSYRDAELNPYERQRRQIVADFEAIRAALGDNAENAALFTAALARLKAEFLGGVREFYDSLLSGEASGLNTEQRYSAAMAQYQQLLAAVNSGDLSQADALRASGEELTRLAGAMWGSSTGGFAELRQRILTDLARLLDIPEPSAAAGAPGTTGFAAPPATGGVAQTNAAVATVAETGKLQVQATQEMGAVVSFEARRLETLLARIADTLDRMDERDESETTQQPPTRYGDL